MSEPGPEDVAEALRHGIAPSTLLDDELADGRAQAGDEPPATDDAQP